jgi:hypothetical protein
VNVISNNYGLGHDDLYVPRRSRIHTDNSVEFKYYDKPANSININNGFMQGPVTLQPPIYPSYPPPYPAQLRGIQIQIRVADPSNQRVKSLTIRQDFTDKL